MQKFHVKGFWDIAKYWHDSKIGLMINDINRKNGDPVSMPESEREIMLARLSELHHMCLELELNVSAGLIASSRNSPPETEAVMNILENSIKIEFENTLLLRVATSRKSYYDNPDIINESAKVAFPNAYQELRRASDSYAFELNTACVFHCMRALEYGLKALSANLGIEYSTQQWKNLLDQCNARISQEREKPNNTQKQNRLQFLSDASVEFSHYKDAWRNFVSHNKVEYDQNQAKRVLDHVVSFLQTLSKELKE